jgi:hypothetical protein
MTQKKTTTTTTTTVSKQVTTVPRRLGAWALALVAAAVLPLAGCGDEKACNPMCVPGYVAQGCGCVLAGDGGVGDAGAIDAGADASTGDAAPTADARPTGDAAPAGDGAAVQCTLRVSPPTGGPTTLYRVEGTGFPRSTMASPTNVGVTVSLAGRPVKYASILFAPDSTVFSWTINETLPPPEPPPAPFAAGTYDVEAREERGACTVSTTFTVSP